MSEIQKQAERERLEYELRRDEHARRLEEHLRILLEHLQKEGAAVKAALAAISEIDRGRD